MMKKYLQKKSQKRKTIIKLLNTGLNEENKKKRDVFMSDYRKKSNKKHDEEEFLDINKIINI